MNENAAKIIVLPSSKERKERKERKEPNENSANETKKVAKKEVIKRQITTTPKWTFSQDDIHQANQPNHLYDKAKQPLLYQQLKAKLSSYRTQDNEKGFVDQQPMDISGVIQKLEQSNFKCFYCKEIVLILYDNVRDPRQWTLERLDNKRGHVLDNVEIACLSCNLRRRTMKYERYVLTKEIQKVVKI
jgi:hypothetical protein